MESHFLPPLKRQNFRSGRIRTELLPSSDFLSYEYAPDIKIEYEIEPDIKIEYEYAADIKIEYEPKQNLNISNIKIGHENFTSVESLFHLEHLWTIRPQGGARSPIPAHHLTER